jgi:hypothetical protein
LSDDSLGKNPLREQTKLPVAESMELFHVVTMHGLIFFAAQMWNKAQCIKFLLLANCVKLFSKWSAGV